MEENQINNNKKIISIISIIAIVILGYGIYTLLNSEKIEDTNRNIKEDAYLSNEVIATYEDGEMSLEEFAEIRNQIEVKELFKDDYKYYYEVINNSDKTISTIDVYMVLYDEEYDKPCYVRMESITALRAHSSAIATFYTDEDLIPIAGRRDVFAIPELRYNNLSLANVSVEYDLAKRDKIIIKNNENRKIDHVDGTVVLYDEDNNVVEIDDFYTYDLKPNKTEEGSLVLFSNPNEVTNYKIYLTAYSYVYDD